MRPKGSTSAERLLQEARAGAPSARGRLLDENRSWLKRLARRLLPPGRVRQADASDMVQECLQEADRRLGQFRGEDVSTFRNWLQGILRKLVRKLLRSQRHPIVALPRSPDGEVGIPADHTPVAEKGWLNLQLRWLEQALAELPESDRRLLQLKFFENASYEAIAQTFGQEATREGLAQLRQRVHRLLKKLLLGLVLLEAMEPLPPHYRKVLCARYFRGEAAEQTARALGCPTEIVGRWLTEARKQLPGGLGDQV
jgi:RNA polymerase sigma factor (sigma-70 family)